MRSTTTRRLRDRFEDRVRDWCVVVDQTLETESSLIAFGTRGDQPVVLKVIRQPGDEWRSGEILDAFDGKGVVRVYEYVEGAVLLERLSPGNSLVGIALNGGDNESTEILANVIRKMSPRQLAKEPVAVEDWARGFERYSASGDDQIPGNLVERRMKYTWTSAARNRVRDSSMVIFTTTTFFLILIAVGWPSIRKVWSAKSSTR